MRMDNFSELPPFACMILRRVKIFPNEASCLRLIRALASETDDEWLDGARYLNMEALREQSKNAVTSGGMSEAPNC